MALQQLKIHFRQNARTYVASPHPDSPPFTMPSNLKHVLVHDLRQNSSRGKPIREFSYKSAGQWGALRGFDDDSVAYAPGIGDDGLLVCLRMAFNTDAVAHHQDSCCYAALHNLFKDAKFYSDNIKATHCNGYTVPLHYGLWILDTGDWAGRIVVSISKWGGCPWSQLLRTRYNTLENRLLIGRAFERLHDAGICHRQIQSSDDWRHVLIDIDDRLLSEDDKKNGKAVCYIVGFSSSYLHDCERRLPILEHDSSHLTSPVIGCVEVANVAFMLDFLPKSVFNMPSDPTSKAMQALRWRNDYASRHPHLEQHHISLAQRAKFYRACCAYPEFLVYSLANNGIRRLLAAGIDDHDNLEEIQIIEGSIGEDKHI